MTPEEIVRLECLKLALSDDSCAQVPAVERARAFATFVLGEKGERDE